MDKNTYGEIVVKVGSSSASLLLRRGESFSTFTHPDPLANTPIHQLGGHQMTRVGGTALLGWDKRHR